jgi:hypothetical protein
MQFVMHLLGMLGMVGVPGMAGLVERVPSPQASSSRAAETAAPKLTLAFTINVHVGPPTELGEVPRGRRRRRWTDRLKAQGSRLKQNLRYVFEGFA